MENKHESDITSRQQTVAVLIPPTRTSSTISAESSPVVVDGQVTKGINMADKSDTSQVNRIIYRVGFILRLLGLIGIAYVLAIVIPAGGFFILVFFAYWQVAIPSLLALAIGHYLASNWKNR